MKAEQRQHPRYRIRKAEFQVFSHGTRIIGRLLNVSQGGLAFQCPMSIDKNVECKAIDILGPEPDRFYISGIACRSIYDIGVLLEGQTFTGNETRLCGVQFIDRTDEQTQKLTALNDRYGVKIRTIP